MLRYQNKWHSSSISTIWLFASERKCATLLAFSVYIGFYECLGELNSRHFETGTDIKFCSCPRHIFARCETFWCIYIAIIGSEQRHDGQTHAPKIHVAKKFFFLIFWIYFRRMYLKKKYSINIKYKNIKIDKLLNVK